MLSFSCGIMSNNSKRGDLEDSLGLCLVCSDPARRMNSWVHPGRSGTRLEALLGTYFLKPVLSVVPWPQLFYIFIVRYKRVFLELFFKNKRKLLAVPGNKPKSPKLECQPCCTMPATDVLQHLVQALFSFQGRGLTEYPIFLDPPIILPN